MTRSSYFKKYSQAQNKSVLSLKNMSIENIITKSNFKLKKNILSQSFDHDSPIIPEINCNKFKFKNLLSSDKKKDFDLLSNQALLNHPNKNSSK